MIIGQVGNFEPAASTENHVRQALTNNGHHVVTYQENDSATWRTLVDDVERWGLDAVMWTRTWHLPEFDQRGVLDGLAAAGVPTIGYHLDRWWGLDREHQVAEEPFFRCAVVVTADGGHDAEWADVGVNHRWMPPAILRAEAERIGHSTARYRSDVAFVGSWRRYHPEWTWRPAMVEGIMRRYRHRCGVWPGNLPAIRGQALADLYATAKVVVGDSCLVGGATHYWSDRIPETLGRGGFLVHPEVEGLSEHFTEGEHLVTYKAGDLDGLFAVIDRWLADPEGRARIAAAGKAHVLEHHTYEHRMDQVLALVAA